MIGGLLRGCPGILFHHALLVLLHRELDDLCQVQGAAVGGLGDLFATAEAIGDDQRVPGGPAYGRQQDAPYTGRFFGRRVSREEPRTRHALLTDIRFTNKLSEAQMTCSERVSQWTESVSSHLPHLSRPQAGVLAVWGLGMVLSRRCGLSQVIVVLALRLRQHEETLRQRLREWYSPAEEKSGTHRRTLEVETCFAPLLRWVLAWWPEDHQELDATTLGQRFTVLCISVLVRGCAILVA